MSKTIYAKVHRDYHHDLDATRRLTLPAGWAGAVSADVAKAIEKDGAGIVGASLADVRDAEGGAAAKGAAAVAAGEAEPAAGPAGDKPAPAKAKKR